jgi:hypothetical protein
LPMTFSTYMVFFIYVAIPPLVLLGLLYSNSLYPSSSGFIVFSASHVSYMHNCLVPFTVVVNKVSGNLILVY